MKYPKIVRDNIDFNNDSDICNIGYYEGVLKDERPIRCEFWYTREVNMMTAFISVIDLNEDKVISYLEDNNIIEVIQNKIYIEKNIDIEDNEFYVVNIPLDLKDDIINKNLVSITAF